MADEKELMKLKVTELKQKLWELGITPKGLKADLVRQLHSALQQQSQEAENVEESEDEVVEEESQQEKLEEENIRETSDNEDVNQGLAEETSIDASLPTGETVYYANNGDNTQDSIPEKEESIDSVENQNNGLVSDSFVDNYEESQQSSNVQESENANVQYDSESSKEYVQSSDFESNINQFDQEESVSMDNFTSVQQQEEEDSNSVSQNDEVESVQKIFEEEILIETNSSLELVHQQLKQELNEVCQNIHVNEEKEIKQEDEEEVQVVENNKDNKENIEKVKDLANFEEENEQEIWKTLNMTEEEWSKLNKNQKRKLKKKIRNKVKRKERDAIEQRRQEILSLVKQKQQKELEAQKEIKVEDDDDRMDIDEDDEPEEERERKRIEQQKLLAEKNKNNDKSNILDENQVEIEYVPEDMPKDSIYLQYIKVFDKFSAVSSDEANRLEAERLAAELSKNRDDRAKLLELKKPVELELKDDEDNNDGNAKLSKRKMKQLTRMSVADLKQRVFHPELVEMHDITAKDPVLLLHLKATRNTVPVPRHWCYKRKYLQGKRGFEKPPFKLPEFIKRTGIQEMREAVQEKEDSKSLKNKMREKIRPKMGKIDIDYQKLHDAFFKWQTKPKLTIHGDLYYEGKEFETRLKDKKPGELTNELRAALGMPTGPNAHKCPPPWLIAMQRYGPPPSYPNLKIPGLNAPIPEGCCFGYHAGGWGKPPVDEYGRPLYGDVFGLTAANREVNMPEEEVDKSKWGELESDEESEAEESEEEEIDESATDKVDDSGLVTPAAEGLVTPSGLTSGIPSGLETPDMIELRKRKQQIESEMESGDNQQQLYTVIPEKKVDKFGKEMLGSMHVYDFASLSKTKSSSSGGGSGSGVDVTLDPSELEAGTLDSSTMAAKYEQTIRQSSNNNPHEDLSDMVAEYAATRQKRKKPDSSSGSSGGSSSKSSKKYQFKF